MGSGFKISDHENGKKINLSSGFGNRAKILDLFYAANFLVGSLVFLYLGVSEFIKPDATIVAAIIAMAAFVAFAIGFVRFINKATETEKLFINRDKLEIINSTLFNQRKRTYQVNEISNFKFNEKPKYEPHPLKGETFDYLGFQTEQQVIQDLHAEGRISFDYKGHHIRFGKEVYQWEFEELEIILYDITGNDFRYTDKFEQENFPEN